MSSWRTMAASLAWPGISDAPDLRVKLGFLRTRVARRTLGLFLACALAPTTALALVSYLHVRTEMIAQADVRLRRDAKSESARVLERLAAHAGQLALLASADRGSNHGTSELLRHSIFRALAHDSAGFVRAIAGALSNEPPALTDRQRTQLAEGRTILVVRPAAAGPVILFARGLERRDSSGTGTILWGESLAAPLLVDVVTEGEHATCLIAPTEEIVLACPLSGLADRGLAEGLASGAPTVTRASIEGEDRFVASWPIFLGYEFAAPDWQVLASDPASEVLSGLDRFRSTFLLVSALALISVFLLSNLQIRRSTEPIERLAEGTRRVALGDFTHAVDVRTDDEYGELAVSFNAMSAELHHQFASLSAMDTIDRAALENRSASPVVNLAIESIARSLASPRAMIALAPVSTGTSWSLRIVDVESGVQQQWRLLPPRQSLAVLGAERCVVRAPGKSSPHAWLLGDARRTIRPPDFAVLPLLHDEILLGILALPIPPDLDYERWSLDARRLGDRLALALSTVRLVDRLDRLSLGTLTAFARAIDANSPWTAGHSERVTAIAMAIGRRMSLGAEELAILQRGGLLHDIGKIGIPPAILDKPDRLSDAELVLVREHPMLGVRILAPIEAFAEVLPIVRHHHERLDGAGYPDGLRGDAIPFLARLLAVADVYDALTSDRPYRTGWSSEKAAAHIAEAQGTHFDPRIVAPFLEAVRAGEIDAALADKHDTTSLARAMEEGRQALTVLA